ncbi:MAG: RHS repeat-associated core domain-containing protein [Bryobacteraceae bacterium]|nr:RHS repeat-associated core domain-containing protein [Bryobacteraceae bacterium]
MLGLTDNSGAVRAERLQYLNGTFATRTYGYDGVSRVASFVESPAGVSQSFGYDRFGNLWQTGAAGVPELRANGFSWYLQPDGEVRNRLANTGYDLQGNQTQLSALPGGTTAAYDGEGRLATVTGGGSATNIYDAEGRRVKRTANGITTYYVYDADGQLMAEYGGTPSGSGTQYLVTDYLGSTRMIQDSNGNCVTRMDYAPFGAVVPRAGQECYAAPWASGMMFTGKERDGDTAAGTQTGLDYFGARYFSGAQGRFTSPDEPFADQDPAEPQSWNLYTYGLNNPLRYTDPDGRAHWDENNSYVGDKDGECQKVGSGTLCWSDKNQQWGTPPAAITAADLNPFSDTLIRR